MTTVCCVCHRTKSGKKWVKKRTTQDAGRMSHGYCPECYAATMERLRIDHLARRLSGCNTVLVK
ncbi:MAG: hypothetical protein AB1413_07305 [Thermodesulfobacteriota bacterium]